MNNSHLNDEEYIKLITELLNAVRQNNTLNSTQHLWEICKNEIQYASINYRKQKSREQISHLHILEKEHRNKTCKLQETPDNVDLENTLTQLEAEIETIYTCKAKGAQIRSSLQILEEGEKNTKYFHSLEKSRQIRKNILILMTYSMEKSAFIKNYIVNHQKTQT